MTSNFKEIKISSIENENDYHLLIGKNQQFAGFSVCGDISYPSVMINNVHNSVIGIVEDRDLANLQINYPNANNGINTYLISESRFLEFVKQEVSSQMLENSPNIDNYDFNSIVSPKKILKKN